jgi:hypothetical protein
MDFLDLENFMMSNKKSLIPPDRLKLYDKLIESDPEIERKGKTVPYTSLNGHMFTFLSKEGIMGLRLSKEDRLEFIQEFNSKLIVQYGRIMKEFVEVPPDLLTNAKTLFKYLKKSINYILTLKPKSTKK